MFGTVRHRALYLYGVEFLANPDQHSSWDEAGKNADRPGSELITGPEQPALK